MTAARRQIGSANATFASTPATTSLAVSLPAAAVANNLLVAAWSVDKASGTFTAPTGWTTLVSRSGASVSLLAAYKIAVGGETSASASWATVSSGAAAIIAEYSGVDTTTPLGPNDLSSYSDTARTSLAFAPATPTSAGIAAAFIGIDTLATTGGFNIAATGYTLALSTAFSTGNGAPGIALSEKATTAGTANSPTFSWTDSDQAQGVLLQINGGAAAPAVPGAATVNSRVVGVPDSSSAVVTVNLSGAATARLKVGTDTAVTQNVVFGPAGTPNAQGDVRLTVSGLTTSTRQFYYRVASTPSGGTESLDTLSTVGAFKTAPTGATSFAFNFGSCTDNPDSAAFSAIAARNDDLFLHLGDLWYADGSGTGVANFRSQFAAKFTAANQGKLHATTSGVYTPSDHEGMNNNSTAGDDPTAWTNWNQVYREKWPTPASIPATTGCYHTFVWGRVRFIVLDDRSFKTADAAADNASKTALGATQKAWLKSTITSATEAAIVIAQSSPWQGPQDGETGWADYQTEKNELGAFFAASGKQIVMLGGDMHAVAAANSGQTVGGITVFQAAPFHNTSSVKGGPYSVGPYPASGSAVVEQYGRVVVTDTGSNITLAFTGYSADNTARVTLSTSTASTGILYSESFTGANGAGWGSNWSYVNPAGSAKIQGNAGQLVTPAVAYSGARADLTGLASRGDTEVSGTVTMPSVGAEQWATISVNGDTGSNADNSNNSYALTLAYGDAQYKLRTTVNGQNTTVASVGFGLAGGGVYGFRFQRSGQVLNAKVWDAASAEPASWGLTYTLPGTPLTGFVGLGAGNGADAVARSAIYDNVVVGLPTTSAPPPAAAGASVLFTETFSGTNGARWSTKWDYLNPAGSLTIQNNTGQLTTTTGAYVSSRADLTGIASNGPTDVTGTVVMPSVGAEQWAVISLDGDTGGNSDNSNNSYALVMAYADNVYRLRVTTNGSNSTVVETPFTLTGGVTYGFRFQRVGQVLKARVWNAASAEPTVWGSTYTITGTPLAGFVGLGVANGADGVSRSAQFDNVVVSVPSDPTAGLGYLKAWSGSAFVPKPMKVWNGSAWVQKPVKRWDGVNWVLLNTPRTVTDSGVPMPVGNLSGWTQFIAQDFSTPAPLGSFESVYPNWSQYDGASDTSANTLRPANRVGLYDSATVCSVTNSVFDGYLHTGSDGQPRVFALTPPNQTGDIYGRYSVRFKTDNVPQYKIAWLLWPFDDVWAEGELDFPEGGLDEQISGFAHDTTGNPGNNAWAIDTGVAVASGWHTATIEWMPTRLNYILDGVTYSTTNSVAIPTHKMRWVLQTETWIDSQVPDPGLAGHVQIDWVVGYHYG